MLSMLSVISVIDDDASVRAAAFPDESVRARALKVGAICFLAKPFAGRVLINCIETALNRRRGGAGK